MTNVNETTNDLNEAFTDNVIAINPANDENEAIQELQPHEFADIFSLLDHDALKRLSEDIKAHGLREPIMLYEGKILDGRNRYKACETAKIIPQTQEFTGDRKQALDYVLSLNLHRRQMDESQRALAAARFLNQSDGRFIRKDAESIFKVSVSSIGFGIKVVNFGHRFLIEDVESGDMPISLAAKVVDMDVLAQGQILDRTTNSKEKRRKLASLAVKSPKIHHEDCQCETCKPVKKDGGKVESTFTAAEIADMDAAMYLSGETDRISFVHQAVMNQCNMLQRMEVMAKSANATLYGSTATPEEKQEARKKFLETFISNWKWIDAYYVRDKEKREKIHQENRDAIEAYTIQQAVIKQKKLEDAERKAQEQSDEWDKMAEDARKEKEEAHARDLEEWAKEQEVLRAEAERNGTEFVPTYYRGFATREDYLEWLTY